MIRVAVYGDFRINIEDDSVSTKDIHHAMCRVHTGLDDATIIERDNEIIFIDKKTSLQNQFDIENAQRLRTKRLERIQTLSHIHSIGMPAASREQKEEYFSQASGGLGNKKIPSIFTHIENLAGYGNTRKPFKYTQLNINPADEYTHEILGRYASVGSYEHLVGKHAKIIQYCIDLEVYVIEVKDDDRQYVVRKKDIKNP